MAEAKGVWLRPAFAAFQTLSLRCWLVLLCSSSRFAQEPVGKVQCRAWGYCLAAEGWLMMADENGSSLSAQSFQYLLAGGPNDLTFDWVQTKEAYSLEPAAAHRST